MTAIASDRLVDRAARLMPGGVSSPVRAYRGVGGEPPFIARGEGARVWDTSGHEYIDMVCSWGPLIAGHAHPAVVDAIERQARLGTSYGAPSPLEIELAEAITASLPAVEMLRFVSSGTEAAMSAVRLARAATGREKILKFAGCYHGHSDALLAKAGSGVATFGLPDSAGVTAGTARDTLTATYNDLAATETLARDVPLAAILVEPYAGNMGCVPPEPGFLRGLRDVCDETGALLVFDEVITGFRLARGGAQGLARVRPDITCLGKVIGGGLPVGAYGASRSLMSYVAPLGPMYQAGTLSGNPLAMAAGLATLSLLDAPAYEELERSSARLERGLADALLKAGVNGCVQRAGSLLTLFFARGPIRNDSDAARIDRDAFAAFHRAMLGRGVMLPPSQLECWFVSLAHRDAVIHRVVRAASDSLMEIAR
ncbi:MAG: glutamate-1-semialdehyde 2,1-aminomutase [Chloroflexota bacterium]|nr:glutamate-1-semialdehyde 2,1-aminomutase [Chloroflexota bacterium]